ncbi:phosphoglycerate dehydrogenase, partial [Mesorhizobium sp. M1A.F.Ca.IN.020.06.1.1]
MKILVGWHATEDELARFRDAVPGATVVAPKPEPY